MTEDLTTLTRIIAADRSAAVVFRDEDAASEILSTLKPTLHVVGPQRALEAPFSVPIDQSSNALVDFADLLFHCASPLWKPHG